eukprot:m.177503 g.177503  ORF g.177503 m.177503 type:complete len:216 (-) comp14362_c0_seq1:175-822(-)
MGCGGSKAAGVVSCEPVKKTESGVEVQEPVTSTTAPTTAATTAESSARESSAKTNRSTDSGVVEAETTERPDQPTPTTRVSSKGGAVAFEVNFGDSAPLSGTPRKLPPRLKSLDKRTSREITQSDIDAKLERAEKLRMRVSAEKTARSQMESEKVTMVHTHMVREKTILGEKKLEDDEAAMKEREQHLQALRSKLQEQKERKSKSRSLGGARVST